MKNSLSDMMVFVLRYIKSALTSIFIIYLSLAPSAEFDGLKKLHLFEGFDKLMHLMFYFLLAVFLLHEYGKFTTLRYLHPSRLLVAFVYPVLLGVTMEFFQGCFSHTRTAEFADVMFNSAGIVVAWLVVLFVVYKTGYLKRK